MSESRRLLPVEGLVHLSAWVAWNQSPPLFPGQEILLAASPHHQAVSTLPLGAMLPFFLFVESRLVVVFF